MEEEDGGEARGRGGGRLCCSVYKEPAALQKGGEEATWVTDDDECRDPAGRSVRHTASL